ncbi:protein MOS2 [Phoenix dactylifera]|uniref:Protein MOS2 n=1 Tax=Phoenix dactylifera TaxID=42345 RepID=A0A8B8J206_PHODC|nr:protein MOS2 [Phoenix dactylifera]XP_026658932.2 protein MOS2 [Phoenix dactylifera]XP_026658933.2 protein MOS2 [Phoenix dactylifera]XP_026658934.2 protein MOS2 [Phoenix dactylifera]XP_026658935.2 protein MOS2 [Phoenix dactylifera]XP_026658936.2 protein MOS2 [Phoenix dactylifera]XP_026658937.2 protein MOS2 [Phoenix dactylifera]XP_038979421.1 protein MOS2 [Phoenix dactylifera]
MKLSFSLSSKSSKPPQEILNGGGKAEDGEAKPQFVTVFDPAQTLDAPAKLVIPPIPNVDLRPTKKMKSLLPTAEDDPSAAAASETRFVLDTSTGDAPASNIPYGLTLRSNGAAASADSRSQEEDGDRHRAASVEDSMLRRFKEDMENLPEDRGFDEFNDIPVEGFGAALLAGYGWSEGKGIGRNKKGDTKVVQYERRAGTEGLGYVPSSRDPKKRKGQWVSQEEKEKQEKDKDKDKIVRVISGRHTGMKGKVLKGSVASKILLKLLETGEEVKLEGDMVVELGSEKEETFLRRLNELKVAEKDDKREDKRNRDKRREEKRGRDEEVKKGEDLHQRLSSGCGERSRAARWLKNHIRVRIISEDFMGGKLFLQKGEVVDVVGPTTCDIAMDGSRKLLQGVDQEILETALPRRGGPVLVLCGKHEGVFGSLVERNKEDETAVVRDADTHALITVRLEQIAEYTADPSYIGY